MTTAATSATTLDDLEAALCRLLEWFESAYSGWSARTRRRFAKLRVVVGQILAGTAHILDCLERLVPVLTILVQLAAAFL